MGVRRWRKWRQSVERRKGGVSRPGPARCSRVVAGVTMNIRTHHRMRRPHLDRPATQHIYDDGAERIGAVLVYVRPGQIEDARDRQAVAMPFGEGGEAPLVGELEGAIGIGGEIRCKRAFRSVYRARGGKEDALRICALHGTRNRFGDLSVQPHVVRRREGVHAVLGEKSIVKKHGGCVRRQQLQVAQRPHLDAPARRQRQGGSFGAERLYPFCKAFAQRLVEDVERGPAQPATRADDREVRLAGPDLLGKLRRQAETESHGCARCRQAHGAGLR
jgi:hypothetical protein